MCSWRDCIYHRDDSYGDDVPLCTKHAIEVHRRVDEHIALNQHKMSPQLMAKIYPHAREVSSIGWIYYLRIGEAIKVGYTTNVRKRLQGYEPSAALLACHPGTKADEASLHQQFTPWRTARREWYEPSKAILRHIDVMIRRHGKPPDFEQRKRDRRVWEQPVRTTRG